MVKTPNSVIKIECKPVDRVMKWYVMLKLYVGTGHFLGKTGYNTNGFVLQAAFGFHLYITPLATIEPIPIAVLNDRQLDLLIPGSYPLAIF